MMDGMWSMRDQPRDSPAEGGDFKSPGLAQREKGKEMEMATGMGDADPKDGGVS
ncbi:hypothetical protein SLEP1_g12833 [Rubroshorea leprosula]|uniref:Uncharacterized protein n=1 Tax=Rubroshorea leprosula TaxID=152421 RepID=A0AAV5IDS5_9ROSI|nr:hypothetical protein SLEP1_g12833 [Rubroshorea leprosula]